MTCSIIARDPCTRQIGVACQSHSFAVGAVVPWAEAGVGAVATQAFIEPAYGPEGLVLMKKGLAAPEALESLRGGDPGQELRQVGMVDVQGRVASHTGSRSIPEAGAATGGEYACLANMMGKATVWSAMARAYEDASGDLAQRLLSALEAGEAEGGDLRGKRSAALVVVRSTGSGRPWIDFLFDLRVDDHSDPLAELRRLVRLQRAHDHMNEAARATAARDWAAAEWEYAAAADLDRDNPEIAFWHAVAVLTSGDLDRAGPLMRKAFDADGRWRTLARRLLRAQLSSVPQAESILRWVDAL